MSDIIIFADNTADDLSISLDHVPRIRLTKTAGPYRIATEVRKSGFTCQVIQFFTLFSTENIEKICKKFINNDSLVIAFSTTFWQIEKSKIDIAKLILSIIDQSKKLNNNIQIIFGGPNGLNFLDQVDNVDAVFLGYSDKQFTDYIISIRAKKEIPIPTKKENNTLIYDVTSSDQTFDFCRSQIIYQSEDCVDYGEPMVIEVGRGCIFKCKFCAYPLNGKKKLDFIKHYDVLTEELIYNYENFGIYKYIISDDTFNDSTEKIKELHKIFTSLPFKIYFSCYLRLDLLYAHKEQINLLKEMGMKGCQFGIESFHDRASSTIGKGLGGDKSKQFLKELKNELWGNEIKIVVSLITGLPHETYESYKKTKEWILDSDNLIDSVINSPLQLYNPIIDFNPYKSEFQLNATKFGYYWPNSKNKIQWKNLSSPVKSLEEAILINDKLNLAIATSNRKFLGGFSLFMADRFVKYFEDYRSFEEQLKMNRFEYTTWIINNNKKATQLYLQNYIDSILRL